MGLRGDYSAVTSSMAAERSATFSYLFLIAPGLGRNLFSLRQAVNHNSRLEAKEFTLPLQKLVDDICSFATNLTDGAARQS